MLPLEERMVPTFDKILCELVDQGPLTNLIVPETARTEPSQIARILVMGPDVPDYLSVGQEVVVSPHGGKKFSSEGDERELKLYSMIDIVAVDFPGGLPDGYAS